MFGLIAKMNAHEGKRDALLAILQENAATMPGCLSYVIARDPADANGIWITEVWENEDFHKGSLKLPTVQQAIARAKPLIAGFGHYIPTQPVGGHGLARKDIVQR